MKSLLETIQNYKLFNSGEKIGVACSGGSDSMCLLHFLNKHKAQFGIEVFAINVNHLIRENSINDTIFVENFCSTNSIPLFKIEIDCLKLKQQNNQSSLENIARKARYNFFNSLLENGSVDKICLAHHQSDQAETILLNILRGAGINGASGMDIISNRYIRPLLFSTKEEVLEYLNTNNIEFVTDESNFDVNYTRNFIRQLVMPLLKTRFPRAEKNICAFGSKCKNDNDFINSQVPVENLIINSDYVKIPLHCFDNDESIVNRIIYESFKALNCQNDMELKHILLVKEIAVQTLKKTELPNNLNCIKENNFVVIYKNLQCNNEYKFECKDFNFNNLCDIIIEKCTSNQIKKGVLKFDYDKLPSNTIWRTRKEGDIFTKVNGKTQKLKDFLIERKIPQRNRSVIPVLAKGNEVFICGNLEISDKIKVEKNSKNVYKIKIEKNFKE